MEVLVKKVSDNINPLFLKDFKKILLMQIAYQVLLFALFYFFPPFIKIKPVLYFNYSSYFFIFLSSAITIKYTIANRVIIYLFALQFLYYSFIPITLYIPNIYLLHIILTYSFLLLVPFYLFFYSITPNAEKTQKPLILTLILIILTVTMTYSNINVFSNISLLDNKEYWESLNKLNLNSYYLVLICLSFLLFVWFTYNQGHYLLSEFLPAILAVHTLLIINEIYQLFNYTHLITNYIDGQYFNAVINIGFIIIWLFRLHYVSNPDSKKMEHFVLNYDMLSGYVEKPHNELWDAILIKLGKQKLIFGSLLLFVIICIPLVLIGDISFFSRFNIIVMLFFLVSVMIYAIVYTQRKWFNHIGFLIKENKK